MASNPVLSERAFKNAQVVRPAEPMTLQGTINKAFVLLFVCMVGSFISWTHPQAWMPYLGILAIVALVVALIISFRQHLAPMLSPVYALLEGLILGGVSAAYNAETNGIVFNAVAVTIFVFLVMLTVYKTGLIKMSRGLIIGVVSATAAIALLYIGSFILSLFGVSTAYLTSNSPLSIGISVVICAVAAFNLLLDFYFIDTMTNTYSAPKYMEWYAAFGMLVTLVWLYLEILRLLSKTQRR